MTAGNESRPGVGAARERVRAAALGGLCTRLTACAFTFATAFTFGGDRLRFETVFHVESNGAAREIRDVSFRRLIDFLLIVGLYVVLDFN